MRWLLTVLFWVLFGATTYATHMAGGEMGLRHLNGDNYELFLIFYYDEDQGLDELDDEIQITVFGMSDRLAQDDFVLTREGNSLFLEFANPKCRDENFAVKAYRYSADITLSPLQYNDPLGYYAAWQRCCRNPNVSNLTNSRELGMAYYLEFPSLELARGNSLPEFNPVVREYFCQGKLSTFSMAAVDADGDELKYSLVAPLRGLATPSVKEILNHPGPYPVETTYFPVPGFGGNQGIFIDPNSGMVYLAPAGSGIYIFSVLVEEFRNGQKLGEVRREFEIIVDNCPLNADPTIQLIPSGLGTPINVGDTIFIRDTSDFCHTVFVSDASPNEEVTLKLSPSGYENIPFSLSPNLIQLEDGRAGISELCIPICFEKDEIEPFNVEIIVQDDECPQPGEGNFSFVVAPEFPSNQKPILSTNYVQRVVGQGDKLEINLFAEDVDQEDLLEIVFVDKEDNVSKLGINFEAEPSVQYATARLEWTPDCRIENLEKVRVDFIARDIKCNSDVSDTLSLIILLDPEIGENVQPIGAPNVITPNGDGLNERLEISDLDLMECQKGTFKRFSVYSRWGQLLFSTQGRSLVWEPGNSNPGTYYYLLEFESGTFKGYFSLIR